MGAFIFISNAGWYLIPIWGWWVPTANFPKMHKNGLWVRIIISYPPLEAQQKIPLHISSKDHIQGKVKDFLLRIQTTTLACWKSDASLLDEDKEFLENMKTDRTFTIGPLDLKRLQVAERKVDKLRRQDDYRKKSFNLKAWLLMMM